MKKKLDDYEPGDVIRGTFYVPTKKKKRREHTMIILNVSQQLENGSSHISCVPACSFSSKIPNGESKPCLDLSKYNIPKEFFNISKPVTVLRFAEPQCLKAFEVKEYRGSLRDYTNLWGDICEMMNENFPNYVNLMQEVCSCDCLEEQSIQVGYCLQNEELFYYDYNAMCSCCGFIIGDTSIYFECPECYSNDFVTIIDKKGNVIEVIYSNMC